MDISRRRFFGFLGSSVVAAVVPWRFTTPTLEPPYLTEEYVWKAFNDVNYCSPPVFWLTDEGLEMIRELREREAQRL